MKIYDLIKDAKLSVGKCSGEGLGAFLLAVILLFGLSVLNGKFPVFAALRDIVVKTVGTW